ncbi:uncharacterized protein N7511_009492 [Penicillium nucicola]|uniref:uncharacterized protein n=1 Tax=Penicillium nucicola TaxID=1850975 RepID=UPI0025456427|nr:uncharacterized protein N7511_009492 [Penicillium nucicola]KAJ5747796.1 hypothetical protein N7511_009492 [Penicillium nucicola]
MTQNVNLGQSLLRIHESQLQMSLTTSANFSQSRSHATTTVFSESILENTWITEAPELELRFFISGNWGLDDDVTSFVSRLEPQLCGLNIWSDLGFSASLKTEDDKHWAAGNNSRFRPRCLTLGLRRECGRAIHSKRWILPAVIINAPDACSPPGIPALTLTSIDMHLEYRFHADNLSHSQQSNRDTDPFEQDPSVIAVIQTLDESMDYIVPVRKPDDIMSQAKQSEILTQISGNQRSQSDFVRLFDLGLQRFVIANTRKDSTAMNQRAVSIPIITKSISSMIEESDNHSIRSQAAGFLQYIESSNPDAFGGFTHSARLRSAIHSSLWSVAQTNLSQNTVAPNGIWVIPTDLFPPEINEPEDPMGPSGTHSQQPCIELPLPTHILNTQPSDESIVNYELMLDGTNLESDFEALSIGPDSETIPDTGDSTQTSLDISYSAIATSQSLRANNDMIFDLEHDNEFSDSYALMDDEYSWEVAEYIGSPDSDIMLYDVF